MSEASDIFNALPMDVREKAIPSCNELMILQLKREKRSLMGNARRMCSEIDDHIRSLERLNRILLDKLAAHDKESK